MNERLLNLYRHVKTGGIYRPLHEGKNENDLMPVVVYQSIETGEVWVRPTSEFFDGRFEVYNGISEFYGSMPDLPDPSCGCRKCNPRANWFIVCSICHNKRCPHATDHDNACTNSNESGQVGSVFGIMPEEHS